MSGEKTENTECRNLDYRCLDRYLDECERRYIRYALLEFIIGFVMGIMGENQLVPEGWPKAVLLSILIVLGLYPFLMPILSQYPD